MQIYAKNAHFYLLNNMAAFFYQKLRKFDALSAQFSKQNYGS